MGEPITKQSKRQNKRNRKKTRTDQVQQAGNKRTAQEERKTQTKKETGIIQNKNRMKAKRNKPIKQESRREETKEKKLDITK